MPTAVSDDEESGDDATPPATRERRPREANAGFNYSPTHHLQRTQSVQPNYISIHTHTHTTHYQRTPDEESLEVADEDEEVFQAPRRPRKKKCAGLPPD